ncbi:MAG: hypothetical protein ACREA5_06905 [Nitrosotalea sp.]
MPSDKYVEIDYITNNLMNLALENGLTTSHDFALNMNLDDVSGEHQRIERLSNAQHHAQMLFHFIINNYEKFNVHFSMEFDKILRRLRKMIVANSIREH